MRYTIYRGAVPVVANIYAEGTVTEKIMGDESVSLNFTSTAKVEFHIGDRITVFGKDYFLSADPVTVKKNSREFQYSLLFFSVKYALRDIQLFFYDDENELTLPDFSIMGTAEMCLDVVLANANRVSSGWTKGAVDETEVKNVSFSDSNCLEAISKIADEFKLEYWIDSNKSIHFTERKPVSGYSFEYGKAKGLRDITRSVLEGGSLVTRLYVKGADKNLPKNYRGGQKNLRIDVPYLEKNIDMYGVKEHTETFADIYPKRVGTVTAIDEDDPNRFTDADLDFDLNAYNEYGTTVLMNGVAAKVIFQTGQLAGYRLELIEAGGFNFATKTFYFNPNKDEKDLQIPSEVMRPAVGDKYIIEDIMMPQTYVTAAEAELKVKGLEYLELNSKERFQYALNSDAIYFKNQNINIQLGQTARFKDADFGLDDDIRVTGLTKSIQNRFDVQFDLSEVTAVSSIVQNYYEQQEQTNTIISSIKYNAELARRNYLFAREFHDNVFDGEGYYKAENIKPLSIETKMLSLGSRLQQFGLPGVNFQLQNNNALSNTAGKIAHQTIDPNAIREWNIAANTVIGISNAFNYIYIKCQKVGTNANFVVTQAQIKVEQDPDFYHFEVGYLSSVADGYRKIKTTYGFAQLNPAELSIGRISDPTGNNYIDLLQDKIAIKAKVEFTSDSPAFEQVNSQIIIGGRNLAKNSKREINQNTDWLGDFELSEPLVIGQTYTLTMDVAMQVPSHYFDINHVGGALTNVFPANGKGVKTFVATAAASKIIIVRAPFGSGGWYQFHKLKIEKGTKATDWTPAPEDVENDIQAVQDYATTVNNLVSDIANDNKITSSEKQQLKQEYDVIVAEKPQVTAQGTSYGITVAVNAYNNAYTNLVTFVNPLLVNLATTSDVDGVTLRSRFTIYYTAKVNLLKAITDQIDDSFDTVFEEMEALQQSIDTEIADVNNQINDLGNYIDGSFSDGIISQAEAVAIEKYLNQINTEKSDVQNKYNQINADTYLSGTPKSNLETAWNGFSTAHGNLINSINTAIADGTTTASEKADVDAKFLQYRNALAALSTRFQEATKAIETAMINAIQVGARNLITKFPKEKSYPAMGFWDFFPLSEKLKEGETYILNGIVENVGGLITIGLNNFDGYNPYFVYVPINTPFVASNEMANRTHFSIANQTGIGTSVFKNFKLEKGTKSTDWSPAPEDIDVAIAGANTNAATALAQAQNAQNTAAAAASVTSFMQTTVDGNVVSTGTLQVGDVIGANAGITGVSDRGRDSVRFYAGSNYAGKDNSAWSVSDNGLHRFHHPNGMLGLEIGVKDGEIVINGYHESGFKTYEMSPNRGLVNVSYIPENFSQQRSKYMGATYDEVSFKNTLVAMVTNTLIDYGPNALPERRYNRQWKLPNDLLGLVYLYSNGTHPNNEQYSSLTGYKSGLNRNQNAQNGWYYFQRSEIIASGWDDLGVYEASAFFGMYKLQDGKVIEVKTIYTQVYAT